MQVEVKSLYPLLHSPAQQFIMAHRSVSYKSRSRTTAASPSSAATPASSPRATSRTDNQGLEM